MNDLAIKSRWELPVIEPKPAPLNERVDELIRDALNLRNWEWVDRMTEPERREMLTELFAAAVGDQRDRAANVYAVAERYIEAWAEEEANED